MAISMGVIAASSRGVPFADSPWINSASSAPFELVIASQVILYRLTALTMHLGWGKQVKRKLPYGLKHANLEQCARRRGSRSLMAQHHACVPPNGFMPDEALDDPWRKTQNETN